MPSSDPSILLEGALAVLGHPIGHSFSPLIHNTALVALGHPAVYVACDVRPEHLAGAVTGLAALGFSGANVTIPHKERVISLMDRLTDRARMVGAVNTISIHRQGSQTILEGDNTDVAGFLGPLAAHDLQGKDVAVLGAGGAARAVLYGLMTTVKPERISVLARRTAQADALIADFAALGPDTLLESCPLDGAGQRISDAALVVNTTPLGMYPNVDTTPCADRSVFKPGQIVYDLVYRPDITRLLREARERKAITIGGLPMLIGQAAAAFEQWTGHPMPLSAVQDALKRHLSRS